MAGIPAKLYWAVTIYNPVDGTMLQTGQPFPLRNQFDTPPSNPDGSLDMYFGSTKPDGVDPKSWIQTLEGKVVLVAIRPYGSGTAFYDQTWKPERSASSAIIVAGHARDQERHAVSGFPSFHDQDRFREHAQAIVTGA